MGAMLVRHFFTTTAAHGGRAIRGLALQTRGRQGRLWTRDRRQCSDIAHKTGDGCGMQRLHHEAAATSTSVGKPPAPSLYLRTKRGDNAGEELEAQPLDMDQPYPAQTDDGYHTLSFYSFFEMTEQTVGALRDRMQTEWGASNSSIVSDKPKDTLGVVGRIYVCGEGINAQLSVPTQNTRALRQWIETDRTLRGRIPRFNWAIEHRKAFKALHVRARPLVAAGAHVDMETLRHEPEYLDPDQWDHELQAMKEADSGTELAPLVVDMRNNYEARIGRFEGAVCPDTDTFRDELDAVRSMSPDKKRPILMYCTGGIRCSVAGAVLRADGYETVKTLAGGVIAYGRHVRARPAGAAPSLFHGKNFTFDKRLGEPVTEHVLAECDQCGSPCDAFTNCANTSCNLLFIQCADCAEKHHRTCGSSLCIERASMTHEQLIANRMGPLWDYRSRIHPEKVFGRDWIARVEKLAAAAAAAQSKQNGS
ncbi:hypothetical protein H4S06_003062 [Coemansia sp. BCRC 34490]|nr:hypothetical protein H4S06_003062 [Coemansia sp. BCRC 34490]